MKALSISDVEKGIENLELLIVQDIFMTLTAGVADVVLPATTSLEKDSQKITIESRHGSIETNVRTTDKIPAGIVFVPFHFDESRVNRLVGKTLDPLSKIPEFKVVAVRLVV